MDKCKHLSYAYACGECLNAYRSALAELVRAQKRYELSLQSSQEEHAAATKELEAAWAAAMALIPEE